MTLLESLGLVFAIVLISGTLAYNLQKGSPTIGDFTEDLDQDLQDKPKIKPTKPRVKKTEQETVEEKTEVVFTPDSAIVAEGDVTFEPAKPKKKRKYYPKKKPTN